MAKELERAVIEFNQKHKFDNVRIKLGVEKENYQYIYFEFSFELSKYRKDIMICTILPTPYEFYLKDLENKYLETINEITIKEGIEV